MVAGIGRSRVGRAPSAAARLATPGPVPMRSAECGARSVQHWVREKGVLDWLLEFR